MKLMKKVQNAMTYTEKKNQQRNKKRIILDEDPNLEF